MSVFIWAHHLLEKTSNELFLHSIPAPPVFISLISQLLFHLFAGHRHQRQPAVVFRGSVLVRHSGECGPWLPGRYDFRQRSGPGDERRRHLHRHFRLGQRCVLAQSANRDLHADGALGLRGGELIWSSLKLDVDDYLWDPWNMIRMTQAVL